ncbi:putative tyrosine-protein kinase YveL [bioreactor metagenome]|uniref:non-specific protein-tyrosine kinase n=1 Tax=bioreactor metagenome TaxID=1076179 RepID=A0A645EGI4_9ZZZZ
MENDGKTTNAINLALSLCPQYKVLLIDADILNPNVLRELQLNINAGILLKNLIDFPDSYSNHIATEPNTGLSVLSLRGSPNSPKRSSDLFGTPQFKSLLDRIKQDYDYVIIDTPPAKMLADASILSQYVDGVILSVRQGHAPIDLVVQTRDDFLLVQSQIIGCIFSDVKHISLDSSDRYRYYERK